MQRVLQMSSRYDCSDLFAQRFLTKKHANKFNVQIIVEFDDFELFNKTICECITQYFVLPYINNVITFENNCFNSQEKQLIYNEIMQSADFEEMREAVAKITCQSSIINIEGIFHFRLNDWLGDLKELCDEVADKYILKNEYLDFIRMLRFFASVNYGNADVVNVVMKSLESADILDESFNFFDLSNVGYSYEFAYAGEVFEYDNVVSVLVEMSPKLIMLHNWKKYKNSQLIETLINIFDERVKFCDGCRFCAEEKNQ